MINLPRETLKKKQLLLIGAIVGCFSLVIVTLSWVLLKKSEQISGATTYKGVMLTGPRRLSPQEVWAEKLTSELEIQGKRLEGVEKLLENLAKHGVSFAQPTAQVGEPLPSPSASFEIANPQPNEGEKPRVPAEELRNDVKKVVTNPDSSSSLATHFPPQSFESKDVTLQEQKKRNAFPFD